MLDPGEDYVGLKEFFVERKELVRLIPTVELFTHNNPPSDPPNTLFRALYIFFVGVASGYIQTGDIGNRTMLIHPSRLTSLHSLLADWIHRITDNWIEILERDDVSDEKADLISSFRVAYDDLNETERDLPLFDQIVNYLVHIIRGTTVTVFNSRSGVRSGPNWYDSYSHVIISGQAVDRGYTVEGLTVTYMPRSVGTGNIDTIQQRARFLGYKKDYLNYCRIFVGQEIRDFYSQYVTHEESVRKELKDFNETGKSLDLWPRQFLLPSRSHPTRKNVLSVGFLVGDYSNRWYFSLSPHFDQLAIETNRIAANQFLDSLNLIPDEGHNDRSDFQKHLSSLDVSLQHLLEELLTKLRFLDQSFTGLRMQIAHYLLSNGDATCSVFKMSSSTCDWTTRKHELNSNDKIRNLMQGAHPNKYGRIYRGDRKIGGRDRVILQVHKLKLTLGDECIASDVIGVAIWIPESLSAGWLVQDQSAVDL